jgi:hypothetical protein
MNKNQKIVISVCAIIIFLMLLFPPFYIQLSGSIFNMGYGFILNPPLYSSSISASVDIAMLLAQWIGTLLLTAIAFFYFKSNNGAHEENKKSKINFKKLY